MALFRPLLKRGTEPSTTVIGAVWCGAVRCPAVATGPRIHKSLARTGRRAQASPHRRGCCCPPRENPVSCIPPSSWCRVLLWARPDCPSIHRSPAVAPQHHRWEPQPDRQRHVLHKSAMRCTLGPRTPVQDLSWDVSYVLGRGQRCGDSQNRQTTPATTSTTPNTPTTGRR